MEESWEDLSSQVRQLQLEVADLRRRVASIEGLTPVESFAQPAPIAAAAPWVENTNPPEALAPLFGWAFLGLSGAYLLRGATESGKVPVLAGVTAGILYAAWWIFLAARRAWESPIASTVHAVTAVLILTPLLFEATVRFHALGAAVSSIVLVAFTGFALAIAWHHKLTAIACSATVAGLLASTALFRETHDALAWVASVLAIAAAVEFSACRDHWLGLRWAAALAADITILVLTQLAAQSGRGNSSAIVSGPLALGAQMGLLCLYLSSTADRTLIRKLPITGFEIGQAIAAFLVGIGGALYLEDLTSVGSLPVGLFCLGCSLACYVITYAVIGRETGQNRNFYAYSTFATALMVVGCGVLLSGRVVGGAWALAAVALVYTGFLTGRVTLRVHGVLLLMLAAFTSGAMQHALFTLIQTGAGAPAWPHVAYVVVLLSAALCSAPMVFGGHRNGQAASHAERLICTVIACWLAGGALAQLVSHVPAGGAPLRTLVLAGLAIGAAKSGAVLRRGELSWISYGFVAAAGLKIVAEDFRLGGSLSVFVSLLLFGGTLIVLPALSRAAPRKRGVAERATA